MIYLIYGGESLRIKTSIKKIAKENIGEIDEFSFVRFDGLETKIQAVVDECNYIPLGCDKKCVSLENAYFLNKPKPKTTIDKEQDFDFFLEYLKNPNPSTDLIISTESSTLAETDEMMTLIREKGKVLQLIEPDEKNWLEYCKKIAREKMQLTIDNDAIEELSNRTRNDIASFKNNLDKLSLYSTHITYEDVAFMVTRPLEDRTFDIFNYLLQRRNKDALAVYRDLRVSNVEPITLISMLANQFRLLNQVAYLSKNGVGDEEGGKMLGIKPIRFKMVKRNAYTLSEKKIHQILDQLFNLDLDIKSGLVDRFYAFEMFIINFKTN